MSATDNSEFAVPDVVADEKEATKEIKGTKRPAEVSRFFSLDQKIKKKKSPKNIDFLPFSFFNF